MKREIKFRGKRVDNKVWIYGSYHLHRNVALCIASKEEAEKNNRALIIQDGMADWGLSVPVHSVEVIPESVGEFTGLKDKNGKEIYEGDIVVAMVDLGPAGEEMRIYPVTYGSFGVNIQEWIYDENVLPEVTGNIYENPELLTTK